MSVHVFCFLLQKFTNNSNEGLTEVQNGKAYGQIVIPPGYTENYLDWLVLRRYIIALL